MPFIHHSKFVDFFECFVSNVVFVDQEWLKLGVAPLVEMYSAATSQDRFDFSRNDADFEELAKRFQSKNTKLSLQYTKTLNANEQHSKDICRGQALTWQRPLCDIYVGLN